MVRLKHFRTIFVAIILATIIYISGMFTHIFEKDFSKHFHYPYDGNIEELVGQLRLNLTPKVSPINRYHFTFMKSPEKCQNFDSLRLVYLVKSGLNNYNNRLAIRQSWGFERRFSDVEIRTVFLIGSSDDENLEEQLHDEDEEFHDLVQANFTDNYFNNTLKTMMGFTWAARFCPQAQFYMFVDDDYYISTKNVLRFSRSPMEYPTFLRTDRQTSLSLYTGYVFQSAPQRHTISKWYITLDEYPYDMWPPYVTAGAYLLSNQALLDMYFTSFYTKHFRFDDIYVGLLAYKSKIKPLHCEHFHFYKLRYDPVGYKNVIASHGYKDYQEMVRVWSQQKEKGNA